VLFTLHTPLAVGPGVTTSFRGEYVDPSGGGRVVNALSTAMVAPAATTDYLFNTLADGTGTNLTTDLTVTATYGTEGVTYSLTNAAAMTGYVTFLQARGKGIYRYNAIEETNSSQRSYDDYGYSSLDIDQPYQQDLTWGGLLSQRILNQYKQPQTDLYSVSFVANRSEDMMQAFLNLDVGDMVQLVETQTAINGNYYIQAVSCTISGGVMQFSWIVKQSFALLAGLTMMAAEFMGGATTDALDCGYLPQVANLHQKSYTAWVYAHSPTTELYSYAIMGNYTGIDDSGGALLHLRQVDLRINWIQDGTTAGSRGEWQTDPIAAGTLLNAWLFISVTRDSDDPANLPKIYVNGVAQTVTQVTAQAGPDADETGNKFVVGNYDYGGAFVAPFNGQITDARVYNRVLSATEVMTIYQANTDVLGNELPIFTNNPVPSGLVFQSPCIHTKDLTAYTNLTLTAEDKMIDNINGMILTPHGAPVSRIVTV
jgi:hypothetical protein